MTQRTLLVFAKPPRMGLSKTRLAAGLGRAEAARIARMCMGRTLRAAADPRWTTILCAAPDAAARDTLAGLWPARLPRRAQGPGDLGARMTRALRAAPRGGVVFIGADAPDLSAGHIWSAFRALLRQDAVFGPAEDGGFWLFGLNMRARTRAPFHGVRWSTRHALDDVAANLPPSARIARLPTLIDLDEAADWTAWRARNSTRRA